jgi:ATP adenylyltransferase
MDRLWTPWRYAYISQADSKNQRHGVPEALAAWPGDLDCVFCNLIAAVDYAVAHGMSAEEAERAGNILLRASHCFVCLNAYPYSSGHLMIVPYRHESSLARLDPAAAQQMMSLAQRATQALESAYSPDGINLGMNLGRAAGAGVAGHLHLHALPRWIGDTNFMSTVAETRVLPEMLADSWRKLREVFRRIGDERI